MTEMLKTLFSGYGIHTKSILEGVLSGMTHKESSPWDLASKEGGNSGMRNERLELREIQEYFADLLI